MVSPADEAVSSPFERRWFVWVLLITLIALAAALRLHRLDSKSLWYDELGTALYAAPDRSVADVVRGPREVPVIPAPPLYFLATYTFRQVSQTEFVLRLPSVFCGLLAIPAIYVLGKALLGPREALIGAFLLTISPFHIRYSQEARYYALLLLLATLSLYFLYRGLCQNRRLFFAGYVVTTTLALYTHLFAFLFLLVECSYGIAYCARRCLDSRDPGAMGGKRPWSRGGPLRSFLVSVLVTALLYIPMLPQTLAGLLGRRGLGGTVRLAVDRRSLGYLAGVLDLLGAGPGLALACYLLALGLGTYALARRARSQLALAMLWVTVPFLIVLLVPAGHNFRLRYVIFVLPVLLLLAAAGLVVLGDLLSKWAGTWAPSRRTALLIQPATLATACLLAGVLSRTPLERYWCEEKQPWDKVAAFLQSVANGDEVVITTNEAHAQRLLYYGYDASAVKYMVPCPCPVNVQQADWHSFSDLASTYRRAWLLDPSPVYRYLGPAGPVAQEVESFLFLPPVVFKARAMGNPMEIELLGPFVTSDVAVFPALPREPQVAQDQIMALASGLAAEAEQRYPDGTRFEFTLGELYRYYGDADQAIAHYQAAIDADARFYPAHAALASIYVRRGETDKAAEIYDQLTKMGLVEESYYHFLVGNFHLLQGDIEAGVAELAVAIRMDAGNLDYRLTLGDAYRDAGRLEEALAQYDEITRLDPSYALAYLHRGSIYRSQGRLAEAMGEYEAVVRLRPSSPFYRAILADVCREQGLLERAEAEATEAVHLQSDQAPYHVLLGEIYRAQGRLSQAIAEFETSVELYPTSVAYHLQLAHAYLIAGQRERAIAEYERALKLEPANPTAAAAIQNLR